jgi:hypothetical protein
LTFEPTLAGPGPDIARIQTTGNYQVPGGAKLGSDLVAGDVVYLFGADPLTIATITPEA